MSGPCPEFGFTIRIEFQPSVPDQQAMVVTNDLISMLEQNALVTAGGGHGGRQFVVTRDGAQATHSDRELVLEWANRWKSHATVTVGDLVDLSHRGRDNPASSDDLSPPEALSQH